MRTSIPRVLVVAAFLAGGCSSGSDADNAAGAGGSSGTVAPQNCVPAGYTGTPFKALQIPGTIHAVDYDKGGPGVAYCHSATATGAACAGGIKMDDWCCTSVRCDQRTNPVCPPYRANAENAGLSMMNEGEPDQDPTGKSISPFEPYISYSNTGEWLKFTVKVTEAGTYSVGGRMAAPRPDQNANPQVSLDFGCGVTTGVFTVPPSVCTATATRCTEGYHVWQMDPDMAQVTFAAPGTYVMTWTLVASFMNPDYFTFTKK
jgi:hypothetical protein